MTTAVVIQLALKLDSLGFGLTSVEGMTYSIGIDGYRYDFDAEGDNPNINETVVNLKLGLALYILASCGRSLDSSGEAAITYPPEVEHNCRTSTVAPQ